MTEAMLNELIGGRDDVCCYEPKVGDIPLDKSIKQGGQESPVSST